MSFLPRVPFPFLLLASYWKVLSESVSAYFGCLPPGGHGGRDKMSKPNETEDKHTDTKIRVMVTRGGVGG